MQADFQMSNMLFSLIKKWSVSIPVQDNEADHFFLNLLRDMDEIAQQV